jgi:hypothetical protein
MQYCTIWLWPQVCDLAGMHPALKTLIETGERELEGLEEPERSLRAAKLHNDLLRKFRPELFEGDEVFDGNLLDDGPLTAKDVEEHIIQDHWDKEDNKTSSEMAEDGCYSDDEGEREPHLPLLRPNPLINHATQGEIRTWDGRLHEEKIPTRLNSGVIERAPELERGMAADPAIHDAKELVSEGDIYWAEKGHADYKPTRPYHDRVAGVMFRAQRPWRKASPTGNMCLHCGEEFSGRKGTKYCSANCRKRAHESK